MLELRATCNDIVSPYAEKFGAKFVPDRRPCVSRKIQFACKNRNLIGSLYAFQVKNYLVIQILLVYHRFIFIHR